MGSRAGFYFMGQIDLILELLASPDASPKQVGAAVLPDIYRVIYATGCGAE